MLQSVSKEAAAAKTAGRGKYVGMIVVQGVLYGVMDSVAKLTYQRMPVYSFLTVRYILACVIMLCIWHKTILRELKKTPVKGYAVPAVCMAAAFMFSNLAVNYTAATNMAFLRSLTVLFVPILAWLFYRKRVQKRELALFAAVLLGLYLLCAKGGLASFGLGEVFALLAAALAAASLVFGQRSLHTVSPITLSFVQAAASVVLCGGMSLIAGSWQAVVEFDAFLVFSLVYAVVFCTIGGYLLQNLALEKLPASTVGVLQCMYPVAAAVVAFVLLGEKLSPLGLLGAAIILACIVLCSRVKET